MMVDDDDCFCLFVVYMGLVKSGGVGFKSQRKIRKRRFNFFWSDPKLRGVPLDTGQLPLEKNYY
jgi:hypothetical protein